MEEAVCPQPSRTGRRLDLDDRTDTNGIVEAGTREDRNSVAAILEAADVDPQRPDRAQTVTNLGEIRTWSSFLDGAQASASSASSTAPPPGTGDNVDVTV